MTPEEEQDAVDMLTGMMGGDVGLDEARRVLRKHKGDVQKAAEAILGGDRGDGDPSTWQDTTRTDATFSEPSSSGAQQASEVPSSNVIDLTSDDNDLTRTWQLDQAQNEVKFGPSERAPDPGLQMVTTNAAIDTNSDDRSLKDAIQASLADFNSEELEVFPVEHTVREGGRPIALRPEASSIVYAALIVQAFFQIPQVRRGIAKLRLPDTYEDPDVPQEEYDGVDRIIFNLVELFTNLDLAQLSSVVDKEVLPSFRPVPWDGTTEALSDLSSGKRYTAVRMWEQQASLLGKDFIRNTGALIENGLNSQRSEEEPELRLFQFLHGQVESRGNAHKVMNRNQPQYGCVVTVEVGDNFAPNDLLARLTHNLSHFMGNAATHEIIFEPSELVIFQLKPFRSSTSGTGKPSAEPFVFPKHFYLDRFILDNFSIADQKRRLEREMQAEINELIKKKEFITHYNNRDTIKDLRASLLYYEHVAEPKGDSERQTIILGMVEKLKRILNTILSEVHEIDVKIEKLQTDVATVFDCPELQNHQYDLRAVFMHTGFPGRKQIYSYVQDGDGIWWKTVDYTVTEVPEETVLTDPTGLHLGAGPYLLFYSRSLSDEDIKAPVAWPEIFADRVEEANKTFLDMLPPELAAKARLSVPNIATLYEVEETQSMDVVEETQTHSR